MRLFSMIFVLLAQSKSPSDDDPLWVLIQNVGVIKPLSIAHIKAQNPEGIQSVSVVWHLNVCLSANRRQYCSIPRSHHSGRQSV
jgi:hypothetical protein